MFASDNSASPKALFPCPLRARFCLSPSIPFDADIRLASTARLIQGMNEFTPPVFSASRNCEPSVDISGWAIFHADLPILPSGPAHGELFWVFWVLAPPSGIRLVR